MVGSFVATRVDRRKFREEFHQGDEFRIRISSSTIILNKPLYECVGETRLDLIAVQDSPDTFKVKFTDSKLGLMFAYGRRAITSPLKKWIAKAEIKQGVYRCVDENAAKVLCEGGAISFTYVEM